MIGLLLPLPLLVFALVLPMALLTGVTDIPPLHLAWVLLQWSLQSYLLGVCVPTSLPSRSSVFPASPFLSRFGWAAGED